MRRPVLISLLIFLLIGAYGLAQTAKASAPKSVSAQFQPGPEMQRLFDAFAGNWRVHETFEVSTSRQNQTRDGTASLRRGPGSSLIEEYKSEGSAGPLRFLGLIWWDRREKVYRLLTCANNDGCDLRGTLKWEGKELVNSWEEKLDGKPAAFKDSFVDISPSSFRLISQGTADGKTIWRVTTKYERESKQ